MENFTSNIVIVTGGASKLENKLTKELLEEDICL